MTEVKCPPTKTRISITQKCLLLHVTFLHNLHQPYQLESQYASAHVYSAARASLRSFSEMNVLFLCWEMRNGGPCRVTVLFCRSSPLMSDINFRKPRYSICPKNGNQLVGSNWRFDDSILFLWSFPNDIWVSSPGDNFTAEPQDSLTSHLCWSQPVFLQFEMFWFLQNVNSAAAPQVIRARGELLMSGLMSSQTPKLCFHFLSWWMNSGKSRSP